MASSLEATDFIPQIDPPVPDVTRTLLESQIHAERPSDHATALHPLVDSSYEPSFPSSLAQEHDRLASGAAKQHGIDLARYEADALEPPNRTFPTSDQDRPEFLAQWRDSLRRAYASTTYLSGRNTNLALLETYGKNAWLVANWHAEAELKALEADLANIKKQEEELQEQRTRKQEAAAAEMAVLESSWKKAVRGLVEVQVATEGLRNGVLERRAHQSAL